MKLYNIFGKCIFEAEVETIRELVEQAMKKEINLMMVNLEGKNLIRIDLSGVNLRGAKLKRHDGFHRRLFLC